MHFSRVQSPLLFAACITPSFAAPSAHPPLPPVRPPVVRPVDPPVLSPSQCCTNLLAAFPGSVSSPSNTAYNSSVSSYWAQQQQLMTPVCIFAPKTAQDVSQALSQVLVPGSCVFAIRGGGHASVTGASNIEEGVTIDLRGISSTSLSANKKTVSVGGGQTIGNVYTYLSKYGLSIAAARDYSIGIGGSTLGGGMGYFSTSQGIAANSVSEYEVVLADGRIVTANKKQNNDLWRALKGGGNNFGIVTKFTFVTQPLGKIWGGDILRYATKPVVEDSVTALYNFVSNPNYDPNAYAFVTSGFSGDQAVILTEYTYAKPVANPPAFSGLLNVSGEVLLNTTAIMTLPEMSQQSDLQSPPGRQQITFALSVTNNVQVLVDSWEILKNSTYKIAGVQNSSWGLTMEPIISDVLSSGPLGDNSVLGIQVPPQGLIMILCSANFDLPADYATVNSAVSQLLKDIISHAKALGVYNRYIDMNHAKAEQDPLASYGPQNLKFIKTTALKYDPKKVFQTLVPGGFKIKA